MSHDLMLIHADTHKGVSADTLSKALLISDIHIHESTAAAAVAISAQGRTPQYLVVDIGKRGQDVLPDLDALAEVCDPSVCVVVAGEINDVGFYRELIKRGIVEYFAYPVDLSAMQQSLQQASSTARIKPAAFTHEVRGPEGFAISFYGAASGNGSSTVALNVAYALAETYQKPTVLVDLDYQFGMIARYLNIQSRYGIKELLEYPDRGIDVSLVNKMASPYSKHLKVIAAPSELRFFPSVNPKTIQDLVKALRTQYAYVIFDIPHCWDEWVQTLQLRLNHNFLVSELWLRSLTHVTRLLGAWHESGLTRDHLSLVINRMGSKFKEAVTLTEFERVSTLKAEFMLPNDTKAVVAAENQGKTVIESGASELRTAYQQIAARMHSLATGVPVEPIDNTNKKSLSGLFAKR